VGAAHRIEVKLLEEEDVIKHALLRHSLASPLIMLMPVHALHQDGLPVDEKLSLLYNNIPEANLQSQEFYCTSPLSVDITSVDITA